jgi:hypothetical protein
VIAAALALLLAGMVSFALLRVERPDQAAGAREERERQALPFRPGDVLAIDIAPRGAAEVRLERAGPAWRLTPSGGEAAALAVDGLLERLAGMRVRSAFPAGPGALSGRGLDPPASRVTLTLRDGTRLALDLGDENPFDRTRFGLRDGRILAIEGVPPAALDPAPDRLLAPPGGG